ncbi:MAG: cysteine--tRNA ligase [Candidatus Micrarchaeia archaeon]
MALRVYNTLSKRLEDFVPGEPGVVRMYVCGLTPYDRFHLGHARTYVAFDIIRRYLEFIGYRVQHVQNITDVDDKILNRARESGQEPLAMAEHFTKLAMQESDLLGIKRAHHYPKVSQHIPDIIALIARLMSGGFAYETEDGVYFDVTKFAGYGKLSGQRLEDIRAGARVAIDEKKRHPADFALWKKWKPGEALAWDSPWGRGRPGWHIECSAMSARYLGESFDIHGGGNDLIFPHHENEIAQSEAASGKPLARYWLHTGWLTVRGEKMAKSLKNFITVAEALARWEPEVLRLFFASTHYRSPLDFNESSLEAARAGLATLRSVLWNAAKARPSRGRPARWLEEAVARHKEAFLTAMDNDFDTSTALAQLFEIARHINTYINEGKINKHVLEHAVAEYRSLAGILGLLERLPERIPTEQHTARLRSLAISIGIAEEKAQQLGFAELMALIISEREKARKAKDFAKGDEIRAKLRELGIILEDTPMGTLWRFV